MPSTTASPDRPPKKSELERVRGHGVTMNPPFPESECMTAAGKAVGSGEWGLDRVYVISIDKHIKKTHTYTHTPYGFM